MHSLPVFLRLHGRPVILVGEGDAAEAKRRLLERAGARIVGEEQVASLAIVAIEDGMEEAVARLRACGVLVNAVDRPDLCDFTLPAIVDRDPVLIAIGTGGASAGLAKTLRLRIEAMLPAALGSLATALHAAREAIRTRWADARQRRIAIDAALAPGGRLDPLGPLTPEAVADWLADETEPQVFRRDRIRLRSPDPDDLTLREARLLGQADRVYYSADVPAAILDRARADAIRIGGEASPNAAPGLTVDISWEER